MAFHKRLGIFHTDCFVWHGWVSFSETFGWIGQRSQLIISSFVITITVSQYSLVLQTLLWSIHLWPETYLTLWWCNECRSFFMMMSPADKMSLQGAFFLLHTPQRWMRINDMSPCCNYKADPVARLGGDGYQSKFLSKENCLQFPFINEGDGTALMWIWCKPAFELPASHRECTQAPAFDYLS